MTVRATMADLITFVRDTVGDSVSTDPSCPNQFTDDQIQRVLDTHRTDVYQMRLTVSDDIDVNGVVNWKHFYAQILYWESSAKIQGNTWHFLTPDESDPFNGEWIFNTSQTLPLWVTGSYYDVWAACADLIRRWMGAVKLDFDFSSVNSGYQRSQKLRAMRSLLREIESRQPMRNIKMTRNDSTPTGRWR